MGPEKLKLQTFLSQMFGRIAYSKHLMRKPINTLRLMAAAGNSMMTLTMHCQVYMKIKTL